MMYWSRRIETSTILCMLFSIISDCLPRMNFLMINFKCVDQSTDDFDWSVIRTTRVDQFAQYFFTLAGSCFFPVTKLGTSFSKKYENEHVAFYFFQVFFHRVFFLSGFSSGCSSVIGC